MGLLDGINSILFVFGPSPTLFAGSGSLFSKSGKIIQFVNGRNVCKISQNSVHLYCVKICRNYLDSSQIFCTFALELKTMATITIKP